MDMKLTPKNFFLIYCCSFFALLLAAWTRSGAAADFFLLLSHLVFFLIRLRLPHMGWTIVIDVLLGLMLGSPLSIVFSLFQALYFGWFLVLPLILYPLMSFEVVGVALSGVFLRFWEVERLKRRNQRDLFTRQQVESAALREDLMTALETVERQAIVSERARISRDLHDNAGYEMVAAYMSLQTIRTLLDTEDADLLELYDVALERLDRGAKTMREAVHDLSTVSHLGVDRLRDMCQNPIISFSAYGDTLQISVGIWHVLETCLKESLTNISRHARATKITVELQVTAHLVRLYIENDGIASTKKPMGTGLRNLRYRAIAMGGNLTVNAAECFSVTCVIPLGRV